ncbi:hypothetical protein D3218_04630 [Aureimonas flava]|uniref:Uncharacterized protein n=1 Tax=Aureimonas flava TaxID=2320271 RepID=A0A3A1WVE2_9HYPH|nr:hypothetical protein D3218_04630 [Aureimonas flava]
MSGCVSDYPVYDDYPLYGGPRVYDARPAIVYEDRYRPRPVYRYDRDPYWRDDRRFGRYDRPPRRDGPRYDGPRYDRPSSSRPGRPSYDRPPPRVAETPPVRRAAPLVRPAPGAQPEIDAGRAFGGRAVAAPRSGPRPYIPPQPAD